MNNEEDEEPQTGINFHAQKPGGQEREVRKNEYCTYRLISFITILLINLIYTALLELIIAINRNPLIIMNFRLTLSTQESHTVIPINYQYPLSAAIYRILAKGDSAYADFLHEQGYGKGFKLFTFSQINVPFGIVGDRLQLKSNEASLIVAFHLPQAVENFVKGLFQSERIEIADRKSKARFTVKSIESLPNTLQSYKENEIVPVQLQVLSPVVAGLQNEKGYYDFLSPNDPRFKESLIYNWRNKIASCYGEEASQNALLMLELNAYKNPPRSRLITIKADTEQETKIRGWINFKLKATAEKRFVELLLNAGIGLYNSQGMGCLEGGGKE